LFCKAPYLQKSEPEERLQGSCRHCVTSMSYCRFHCEFWSNKQSARENCNYKLYRFGRHIPEALAIAYHRVGIPQSPRKEQDLDKPWDHHHWLRSHWGMTDRCDDCDCRRLIECCKLDRADPPPDSGHRSDIRFLLKVQPEEQQLGTFSDF